MIKVDIEQTVAPMAMQKYKIYYFYCNSFCDKGIEREVFIKTRKPIKIEFTKICEENAKMKDEKGNIQIKKLYTIEIKQEELDVNTIIHTTAENFSVEKEIINEVSEWFAFDVIEIMLCQDSQLTLDAIEKKEKLKKLVKEIKIKIKGE